jgi:hypothetical protein
MMKPNRSSPLLLLRLHSNLLAAFLFLSRTVFSDPGCTRMWQLGLARQLDATRCRCDLFFRSGICDWIPRNVAKRYFAQRYLGAPLVYVYQRPSCFRSLFGLHYDKIVGPLDVFVMPNLAALRTAAIQVDGVRVQFRVT